MLMKSPRYVGEWLFGERRGVDPHPIDGSKITPNRRVYLISCKCLPLGTFCVSFPSLKVCHCECVILRWGPDFRLQLCPPTVCEVRDQLVGS